MNARRAILAFVVLLPAAVRADQVTYADTIRPIFQNSCLNCHNPDKQKAGLDLATYESAMAGGDSGKAIEPGNSGKSLLYRLLMHQEEPSMPRNGDKLPDSQLDLIRKWIDSGAPDKSGSMIVKKPDEAGIAAVAVEERPKGPPPMPRDLPLEPVVRTHRAGAIAGLAASPWAPLVAVTGQRQVLLFNTDTLELAGILPFPEGFPDVLRFSRDGRLLLAGGGVGAQLGRVVVWDVVTGERVAEVGDEFDTVLAADISPDHSLIALGGPSKLVKIFSTRDGRLLHKMKKHTDWVTALNFTPDGKFLITGDRAGGLVVWDEKGREMVTLPGHKAAVTAVASISNLVATSSEDGTIKLWDLAEGKERKSWDAHKGGVLSIAFAPNGDIVSCGRDRKARLWDSNGNVLQPFEEFADVAMQTAFAGGKVIAGDWTGVLRVWRTDGKRVGDLDANPPTLAERMDAVAKRLEELEPAERNLLAARKSAEDAAAKSDAEARGALEAFSAKQRDAQSADAKLAALEKELAAANSFPQATPADPLLTGTNETPAPAVTVEEVAAAGKEAAKAKEEVAQMGQSLVPTEAQAKAAEEELAKARQDEAAVASQLGSARNEQVKWRAALVNVQLYKSRDQLAKLQAVYDKAVAGAHAASAELEKARGDLSAEEQAVAQAPEGIKAREAAIIGSRQAIDSANGSVLAAKAAVEQKSAAIQSASDFVAKLQADAAKTPGDDMLAAAAAKAKEAVDLLNRDLAAAQAAVTAREGDAARAVENLSSAQKDLAQANADAASAPARIIQLRAAIVEAEARTAPARALAGAAVDSAAQEVAKAKAAVDDLARNYEALARTAKPPPGVLTVASKK